IGFTVANMQKSLAFYRDKLGFQLKECWPNDKDAQWASLVLDNQTIMLGQSAPAAVCEKMHEKNPAAGKFWGKHATAFAEHTHGVGVVSYIKVADVDKYAAQIGKQGLKPELPPTSQFYGLRDVVLTDPDGYTLTFYTPIALQNCQSCAMPLTDAKPGQMYCGYCVDEKGKLKAYEQVFEGTVTGYFMAHQKMKRPEAEKATKEHLAKMPAWAARKK
ncbi:MAG TPA: VOC family protein, partial [Planctomycetota bacterium]|nr:VOC family protein [Planctomycetota bacterium]